MVRKFNLKEQESRDAQQKIMVEQQRQMQQQQNELLKIMQKQQAKQEGQIQSFQMLFLQQQQSQILMSLLDKRHCYYLFSRKQFSCF